MVTVRGASAVILKARLRAKLGLVDAPCGMEHRTAMRTRPIGAFHGLAIADTRAKALDRVAAVVQKHASAGSARLWLYLSRLSVLGQNHCIVSLIASARPSVLRLLGVAGPSAIVRRVRSVVVDALKRQSRGWTPPHIGHEIGKGQPSVTDRNASTSVVVECLRRRVSTALQHRLPYVVLGAMRFQQTMCRSEYHGANLSIGMAAIG